MKKNYKKIIVLAIVLISMMMWTKAWSQDTLITLTASPGQTVSYNICEQQYTQAILYKPSWASSGIHFFSNDGYGDFWQDSIIITTANDGLWYILSGQGAVEIYIYFVSPPVEHPSMVQDTSFCTSSFSLMLNAGNLNSTYLWSTGATSQTITATTPGTYTVTITNACGTGVYSKTITQANPNAPHLGADQTFCYGNSTVLDPGSTNVASWQWSTGETTQTITVDTTGVYWVYLIDNNGCSGRDTVTITALLPTPLPICYVEFDTLTGKNKINWTINLPSNSDSVRIYKEVSLGVWNLIGVVNNTSFNFIDISSNPQAQSYSYKIAIIDTCENESVLSGSHTTITLLSTYDSGTDTYGFTWSDYLGLTVSDYFLYGITSTGTVSQIGTVPGNIHMYNYLNPISAYVKYFVGFVTPDCNSKANVIVKSNWVQSVVTGINQIETLQFGVYPNPANDKIEISTEESKFETQILNLMGQVLLEESNNKTIDATGLSEGVYIVRLKVGMTIGHQIIIVY